jgi:hypothetical protein
VRHHIGGSGCGRGCVGGRTGVCRGTSGPVCVVGGGWLEASPPACGNSALFCLKEFSLGLKGGSFHRTDFTTVEFKSG